MIRKAIPGNQTYYAKLERGTAKTEKAASAAIFYKKWKAAEADIQHAEMKSVWKKERG